MKRVRSLAAFLIVILVLLDGSSSVSVSAAATPARVISRFFSDAVSALLKWAWSLKTTTKTAISGRPMMRFESGYTVETVFDGSKLGIEPYAVEVSPSGELLVLDSINSNIYRIPPSLSKYSRPKLVAGSAEGYSGHVDGKPREAKMNHPKGITVDDRGNIYVADSMNMAVRKISDTGVTTIAGGKWNKGDHADGPSEDAKLSNDFEVVYIGSSCSLLVVDRGNKAIREIQLHFDDCAYQYGSGFPSGVAVLLAAAFFGYMLALLQRRVGVMVSSNDELEVPVKPSFPTPPYQKPPKSSVRPPLIPSEDDSEKQEEGWFASAGKIFAGAGSFVSEIFSSIFSGSRKKSNNQQFQTQHLQQQQQHQRQMNTWTLQDSYVVSNEDAPPPIETRTPTPRKTYAFMSKDAEKIRHFRQGQAYFNSWDGDLQQQLQQQQLQQQQLQQQQMMHQQHLQRQRHYSSGPHTFYEQSCETTNEIVFGAVQESEKMQTAMEIKAVDYSNPTMYNNQGLRSRICYDGYRHAY